uniref:Uncharacterized protein n=1 Tax=Peromyscus maniculatus bairdii TaxID=230844 RepID=A0A8C8UE18_PERMB
MVVMARVPRPERPDLVFEEEDLPYEEEIMRNQFSVKCWLRYIEFKQGAPKPRLNQLYERALKLGDLFKAPSSPAYLLPPQTTGAFWQTWKDFEVRHGNEDTIREMLRIRRSVQATYNTQVNFMASQMLKVSGSATGTGELLEPPFPYRDHATWGHVLPIPEHSLPSLGLLGLAASGVNPGTLHPGLV